MYSNSERFLSAFNRIDSEIKKLAEEHNEGFTRLITILKRKHPVVKKYQDDLYEFAQLRNAIVHERIEPDFVIAEPHESTVTKIEKIEKEFTHPRKVIPLFKREVQTFNHDDSLSDVLKIVNEKSYSQFPVYRSDEFEGLLTSVGITYWLAEHIEEDLVSLKETKLEEILQSEEDNDNHKFINRHTNVFEAIDLFKDNLNKGTRLFALLITENGKSSEKLMGIVTTWDIIDID